MALDTCTVGRALKNLDLPRATAPGWIGGRHGPSTCSTIQLRPGYSPALEHQSAPATPTATRQSAPESALPPERCPPSLRNPVRHGPGYERIGRNGWWCSIAWRNRWWTRCATCTTNSASPTREDECRRGPARRGAARARRLGCRRCACTISSKRSGVACVRRRVVRESAGPARPPLGTDHDALLGGGVGPPHRGRKSGVCGGVPQKSRTGDAETTSGQRVMR